MKSIDIAGRTFGRWSVLKRVENTSKGQTQWLCRCECGNERVMASIILRRGISRSCGCLLIETTIKRSTKHGHATGGIITPTYHSWVGMIARCTNPKNSHYPSYGGRGIKVHEPWFTFANFLADMGEKPPGTSLERINNDGDYYPNNCQWATLKRQSRNKRNNKLLTWQGKTQTVAAWAEELHISQSTISYRVNHGYSDEECLIGRSPDSLLGLR